MFAAVALVPVLAVYVRDAAPAMVERPAALVPDLASYAWSGFVALSIGVLATLLGLPLAFASGGSSARLALLAFVPLATPAFLASSGYGMIRNKAWGVGAWLAEQSQSGHPWLSAAVDRSFAILGLSLWAAPIAALILAPVAAAARQRLHDPLMLDTRGLPRWVELLSSLGLSPVVASLGVGVLMMGSAVPLHLARVPTAAVQLWAAQDLAPIYGRGAVWLSAWPLIVVAGLAAVVVTSKLMNAMPPSWGAEMGHGTQRPSSRLTRVGVALVVLASTVIPLGFFASAIEHWQTPGPWAAFIKIHGDALWCSVWVACVVAGLVTLLAMWTAHAASDSSRTATALAASGWLAVAFLPGMLVGALTARVWAAFPGPPWLTDPASMLHAQVLRFGALGVFAGLVFRAAEPTDLRDSRRLDGPRTLLNWWRASGSTSCRWWAGTFLAVWMLSLNEIEATVVVQPPGMPSLARKILSDLHFYRTEEMAQAVLLQLAMVTLVCAAVAGVTGRLSRNESGR